MGRVLVWVAHIRRITTWPTKLVIRNGTLVDGTGADRFTGDLAIDDGVITQVGGKAGAGSREIDADGAIVAPGWVDIHTHYDGQVTWDAEMAPSSWHGVTTIVMGNCGVGFAPARPDERDFLIELMEAVEDIPGTALHEGNRLAVGELRRSISMRSRTCPAPSTSARRFPTLRCAHMCRGRLRTKTI